MGINPVGFFSNGVNPVGFIDLSYGVKLRNKPLRVLKNPKGLS